ncbi:AB hydrolase-1 domain-containing protein OS=Ureibacillus acetophenoni OX=614649 GN=SAMN05877842_11395 PE=4 SV=1 [Ureibacillus acetophenoni]
MFEEKVTISEGTKYPLNGMLTIPNGDNHQFPAVVLVQGSGPSNMDAKVGNNTPFKDIADGLTEKGIAVPRYDKRTFVYGKVMKNDVSMSVKEETIEDAIHAVNLLRKHPKIDQNKIFIIGHSFGGMLAPRIDAEGGDFAGIIIMAGSPRKLEEIMMSQNETLINSLNKFLRWIAKKQVAAFSKKFENLYTMTDDEAKAKKLFGGVRAYYFKEMGDHPASEYLTKLEKPIFILQGEKDFQATIKDDFESYKEILYHKENVTYKLYPNLNHLFMPSVYGEIMKVKKEYSVPQKVDKQVIEDIADWILAN